MYQNSSEIHSMRKSCYPHTTQKTWAITDGVEEALKYAQELNGLHFAS